ncbi:MAG TPA: Uma2 family endonuclease [Oscillatoriaceae cyanobacterium M33_DOE_052]|uniref:Uma2 family endonuclease n=1 Tax=Planktothricoides sp. SpSt-374 TaxID=2282167 RepID=A0A7C3VVJ2_9CYAN|nr:Uma2 family endonuclease [Oscillatoriaceae cyanobacterium M33_DOE_052]
MTATHQPLTFPITITWPILPDDFILPDDPRENTEHPLLANALRQALTLELSKDALITTNFVLCAGINNRIIVKAPDWMYVRPVDPWPHPYPRRSYTPHTEGPIPLIVMEFLSENYGEEYSMEFQSRVGKWYFYEQVVKVPIYVIFQPETARLEVYALKSQGYEIQTPSSAGRYWIPGLELLLGIWWGTGNNRTGNWLRWWNSAGEMLPWPEEVAATDRERAETERLRAEQLAQQAETERQRAQTERQRADAERQRAEAERLRAAQLEQRLRELGVDPDR